MSSQRVALLRGINVGRAKRVRMEALRACVEALGYTSVRTVVNSGNVVFEAPRVASGTAARRIQEALEAATGVTSKVTVLTGDELVAVLAANPLERGGRDPSRLHIAVAASAATLERLEAVAKKDWAPEEIALGERVAYLWCPNGMSGGVVATEVLRALGDEVTVRNVATMRRLERLLSDR